MARFISVASMGSDVYALLHGEYVPFIIVKMTDGKWERIAFNDVPADVLKTLASR